MIRVIDERDEDGTPARWHDVPTFDLTRLPPRLADQFDRECAEVDGYGITCYGQALWKAEQIRRGYFKAMEMGAVRAAAEPGMWEQPNFDRSTEPAEPSDEDVQEAAIEAANQWLARQKDQRDVAVAALWATMAKSSTPYAVQALYDGELDYVEIADPVPIPKRPQDRKPGKAKAGSASRPAPVPA